MNAMTMALKSAGVKTPSQMERIWTLLHDSPRAMVGLRAVEIGNALMIPQVSTSTLLSQMVRRKMLCVVPDSHTGPLRYRALGNTYELRPKPAKTLRQVVELAKPVPKEPAATHGVDLDSMTVGQIKALLNDIQKLFGK